MHSAWILRAIVALAGRRRGPGRVEDLTPPAAPASMPRVRPVVVGRDGLPAVAHACDAFALDWHRRMRVHPGNLLAAPAANSAGLATLLAGALGEILHRPPSRATSQRS